MTHKSLIVVFTCCIALAGSLMMLSLFKPDASAAPTAVSVQIDVITSSFAGFSGVSTTDTRVLAAGSVMVNLRATGLDAYNAASLRIYTKNDPGSPDHVRDGMVGQAIPTDTVPIRVWTPNFGPDVDVPGVDNDLNWHGFWQHVLDWNHPITETWWATLPITHPYYDPQCAWCHPLFNYTDLFKWSDYHDRVDRHGDYVYHLPSSLNLHEPVHIALVVERKAHPQVYSTQVYFEFALSNDGGNTFTTYTKNMPLSIILNDASPVVNLSVDTSGFSGFPGLDYWPKRVLASGHVTLTLSAYGLYPYDAATIRIYTKNSSDDPSQDRLGLVGECDPDWTVPIKVWTSNFGEGIDRDGDHVPDINNDTNWRDNEKAVWIYAFDWNHPITETWWATLPITHPYYDPQCAWCHPLFNYTDLFKWSDYHDRVDTYGDYVYHLPNYLELTDRRPQGGEDHRVPLYFAADFTDASPQTYSTILYIKFAFSSDKGDTVATSKVVSVTISATVPGDRDPVNWLLNRVAMRPDMDATNSTVEKLADSHQEALDWSDGGWTYDEALIVIALTAAGHYEEARQVLSGLEYLQNDDGSWFFSYMTLATDEMVRQWATTDETTLYNGTTCLTETISGRNGYPDELEKKVCWDVTHGLPLDQIGPWILQDYTTTPSPQTKTRLPDRIKYRTYDFRKYAGANAWVVMAANFYEMQTCDHSYRQMALDGLDWLATRPYSDTNPISPTYGAIGMGRVWSQADVTATLTTTYGFVDRPIYVAEHNFDAYSAFRAMGQLAGDSAYTQTAELIREFLLRELWAPHVITSTHPEVRLVDNFFFPGIDTSDPLTPQGIIDTFLYLDGQTWSNLALGPETGVKNRDGVTTTLAIALDFPDQINPKTGRPYMLVTDTAIFSGTCYIAAGIDGYKETFSSTLEVAPDNPYGDFVWSEGSEGMVAARYLAGDSVKANYYHTETASYMMSNGGVPYSTLPVSPSVPLWNWTDANSIAGTAWFYFNEHSPRINPFQPWTLPPPSCIYLPLVMKMSPIIRR